MQIGPGYFLESINSRSHHGSTSDEIEAMCVSNLYKRLKYLLNTRPFSRIHSTTETIVGVQSSIHGNSLGASRREPVRALHSAAMRRRRDEDPRLMEGRLDDVS